MASHYVLKLGELSRRDIPQVGVKAANLGDLTAAGFPVPDGFVLTTATFERFVTRHGFAADAPAEAVARAPLPDDVVESLWAGAAMFGDAPLAVRSSGVAEDLARLRVATVTPTDIHPRAPSATSS
jgi:rifampicin phosphotransferase